MSDLCIYAAVSLRKMSPLNVQWKGEERSSSHRFLEIKCKTFGVLKGDLHRFAESHEEQGESREPPLNETYFF